jgi:hypothetical protein
MTKENANLNNPNTPELNDEQLEIVVGGATSYPPRGCTGSISTCATCPGNCTLRSFARTANTAGPVALNP